MPPSPLASSAFSHGARSARAVMLEVGFPVNLPDPLKEAAGMAAQTAFSDSSTLASARHSASTRGRMAATICGLRSWLGSTLPVADGLADHLHLFRGDQIVGGQ